MGRVLVFGSLNADFVIKVKRFPKPGETVLGLGYQRGPGGKGANQAISAGRLGVHTLMFGQVGLDSNGEMLLSNLTVNGVDTNFVHCSNGVDTGVAFVALESSGENSIVVIPGANHSFSMKHYPALEDLVQEDDIIVAQLEIPLETVLKVGELANRRGSTFVLNAAPASPLPKELLDTVNVLVVNETELSIIVGKNLETMDDIYSAARSLGSPTRGVVVTLGSNGALLGENQKSLIHFPAIKVDVVDSTGAGDAFVGGMAAMLSEGMSLSDAVSFATVVGGLATTKVGAQTGMPTREEACKIWRRIPNSQREVG